MKKYALIIGSLFIAMGVSLAAPRTFPFERFDASPYYLVALVIGTIFLILSESNSGFKFRSDAVSILGFVSSFSAGVVAPMPLKAMAFTMALGWLLGLLFGSRTNRWYGLALVTVPFVAAVIFVAFSRFALMLDSISLSPLVSSMFMLLGFSSSFNGALVHLNFEDSVIPIRATLPMVFPLLSWLVLAVVISSSGSIRNAARNGALIVLCGVAHYFILFGISLNLEDVTAMYSEWISGAVWLGLLLIIGNLIKTSHSDQPKSEEQSQTFRPVGVVAAVSAASVVLAVTMFPAGELKSGNVMINEHNSVWEPTDVPLNRELFGVRTMYNYTAFAKELGNYYNVSINRSEITAAALSDIDVLILKCPNSPYKADEIVAIHEFVNKGGGVWLIGDHTDVFGMNVFLNQIGSRWGLTFNGDAAVEPTGGRQIFGSSPAIGHPTVGRMKEPYLSYTSCSVNAPWFANTPIVGNRLFLDKADYSINTFFGDFLPQYDEFFGPVTQTTGFEVGKGRVYAWADSTTFSNFCVFMPGQMEVALDTVHWLNQKNPTVPIRTILMFLGVAGSVVTLLYAGRGERLFSFLMAGSLFGYLMGISYNTRTYSIPVQKKNTTEVSFFVDSRGHSLPLTSPTDKNVPGRYLTAFLAPMRIDLRPVVEFDIIRALERRAVYIPGESLALIDGSKTKLVMRYVEEGGVVLLLDCGLHESHPLLKEIGIVKSNGLRSGILRDKSNKQLSRDTFFSFQPVGEVVAFSGDQAVATVIRKGKGKVLVSTSCGMFSDVSMGENGEIPNQSQYTLYKLIWSVLEA